MRQKCDPSTVPKVLNLRRVAIVSCFLVSVFLLFGESWMFATNPSALRLLNASRVGIFILCWLLLFVIKIGNDPDTISK